MANPNTILGNAVVTFPNDTTANRPGTAGGTRSAVTPTAGMMRFNETTSYMEYYDGTQWNAITVPPTISSISPSYFAAAADVITVTGSNFQTGAIASIISKTGTVYNADTTTVVNGSTVTFPITTAMAVDVNDPFDVRVLNLSGLSAIGTGLLSRAVNPSFTTAPGSIGTIYDTSRSSYSLSPVTATNSESDVTINSYTITSGALPTGLSINSTTGAITGTASAVGTDTTSTFTVTATGTDSSNPSQTVTSSRSFSILVKAPVTTSFFSTGPATFSVPTGVTSVRVLVVAGGAGGGNCFNGSASGGGGGAGGVVVHNTYPVSPGGSVSLSVGAGGAGGAVGIPDLGAAAGKGQDGSSTTFGAITANGGGGGGHYPEISGNPQGIGNPGGSGGGGGGAGGPGIPGGSATQGPSGGGTGYGYGGGTCQGTGISNGSTSCGGGGGAGGAGANGVTNARGGAGGAGYSWPVNSTTYAGGGGGGGAGVDRGGAGGSGGGGAAGNLASPGAAVGTAGTTNRGGGGGGGSAGEGPTVSAGGGAGGPGIVIVNY
jgi:mucin-19